MRAHRTSNRLFDKLDVIAMVIAATFANPAAAAHSHFIPQNITVPTTVAPRASFTANWTVASTIQSAHFVASPMSGQAPLTVTFCASAGIAIDFGDGTSSGMGMAQSGECPTGASSMTKHTYTAAGTYQLRGIPCPGSRNTNCGEVAQQASTVKITVTPAP